jgi:hypothetical protein
MPKLLKPDDLHLHHIELLISTPQYNRKWDDATDKPIESNEVTDKLIQISQLSQQADTPDTLKILASKNNIEKLSTLAGRVKKRDLYNDLACVARSEDLLKNLAENFSLEGLGKITGHSCLFYFTTPRSFGDWMLSETGRAIKGPMVPCLGSSLFGRRETHHGFPIFKGEEGKFLCIDYNNIIPRDFQIDIQQYDTQLRVYPESTYPYLQVMVGDSEEDLTRLICMRYGAYRFRLIDGVDYRDLHSPESHSISHELGECLEWDAQTHDLTKQGLNVHQVRLVDIQPKQDSAPSINTL